MFMKHIVVCMVTALSVVLAIGIGADRALGAWQVDMDPIVVSLRPVLKAAGKAARISYAGTCRMDDQQPLQVPQLNVGQPPPGMTGLSAIRTMFQNEKSVVVTEDALGIIRIRIGEFPDAILGTRISRLNLMPLEQYNAPYARDALFANSDLASAMQKLGLMPPVYVYSYHDTPPTPQLPHLPSRIDDATVDKILDTVATTFGGIVLYGICAQSGLFTIQFVSE